MVFIRHLLCNSSSPTYQAFSDCTKSTNYNWYYRHLHILLFFHFPGKVQVFIYLFDNCVYFSI